VRYLPLSGVIETMGVKEWAQMNVELIRRVTALEEAGYAVTVNHVQNDVELVVRRRKPSRL
jgi:hypothetical protein